MKAISRLVALLQAFGPVLVVAAGVLGYAPVAWAQATCYPPCGPGQMCVQGTCMVPAPAPAPGYQQIAPAPPIYANPPPPSGYQQTSPAQAYPPAQPGAYPPAQPGAYPQPPAGTYSAPAPGAYPPPPNGGYQAAPPSAYQPPPGSGYMPPPGQGYPPSMGAYPPPPPAGYSQRRGFLALPFMGINSYQGDAGKDLGVGFRLGVLLGGHINEMLSANAELTLDVVNLDNATGDTNAADAVFAFSPLVHIPMGNIEFAVGPKLGFRSYNVSVKAGGAETKFKANGYVFGVNAGAFVAVSNSVSLGGLLSAEIRSIHEVCQTFPGQSEACSKVDIDTGDANKVIGLAAAALF